MRCPDPVAEIVTAIIQVGILQIRADGFARRADRCAIEADHIHNLPALLSDYHPELLEFYWNIERRAYIDQSEGKNFAGLSELWDRLAPLVPTEGLARNVVASKQRSSRVA